MMTDTHWVSIVIEILPKVAEPIIGIILVFGSSLSIALLMFGLQSLVNSVFLQKEDPEDLEDPGPAQSDSNPDDPIDLEASQLQTNPTANPSDYHYRPKIGDRIQRRLEQLAERAPKRFEQVLAGRLSLRAVARMFRSNSRS